MRALLDGLSHTPTTPLAVPVASAVPGRAPARPAPAALLLGETPVTSGSVAPVVAAGEDAPTIEALD